MRLLNLRLLHTLFINLRIKKNIHMKKNVLAFKINKYKISFNKYTFCYLKNILFKIKYNHIIIGGIILYIFLDQTYKNNFHIIYFLYNIITLVIQVL
jgi:hypothetical protein